LECVLFADIRFHDTVSRGRLLNRFGKDFEGPYLFFSDSFTTNERVGIDSSLSDNFGRSIIFSMSAFSTFITLSIVGGLPFVMAAAVIGMLYFQGPCFSIIIIMRKWKCFLPESQLARYVS
jgi:hypothetical protein